MKPHCYNRPERAEVGRWVYTGRMSPAGTRRPVRRLRDMATGGWITLVLSMPERPILRWRPAFRDVNACMAYAVPEGTTPAPVRDGWDCDGCRWMPRGET